MVGVGVKQERKMIGSWSVVLSMVILALGVMAAEPAAASDLEGAIGPDVVVFELSGTWDWGAIGGVRAYSVGTTSCNRGDEDLEWIPDENRHPVIAQNLYRVTLADTNQPVEHGKIEMLGISWLKHGFLSVNGSACGTCDHPAAGGEALGPGCSDPYGAGLNGSYSRLGPRSEVNAFTGYYDYPYPSPTGHPDIVGRLQVKESEIIDDPASYKYFVEGHYVAPDDAGAANGMNNASHREAVLSGTFLSVVGATEEGRPGIYAWQDLDPAVTVREVVVPNEGLFIVASKVGDNGDGTWHYQYSVFNLNSHLSGRSFSLPILPNSVISNTGFRDVDYHSGEDLLYDDTDWAVDIGPSTGWVTWFTDDHTTNPNANALRWSTMYNFSFDADSPPQPAFARIGLFRDGGPSAVSVLVEAPADNATPMFADGFEGGDTDSWSEVVP